MRAALLGRSRRYLGVINPVLAVKQLTVTGGSFYIDGSKTRLAMANFYDAVVTDNAAGQANAAVLTPQSTITATLEALKATGHNAVRIHTLLINNDKANTYLPNTGNLFNPTTYNQATLERGDFVLAECRRLGLIVMAPAIDRWAFYHGGAASWAITRLGSSATVTDFLNNADTAGGPVKAAGTGGVMDQWFTHFAVLMNRTNTSTAGKWIDEIQLVESGNEVYDAAFQTFHLRLSAATKALRSTRVVADGSAASGNRPKAWALGDPNTDVVGGHFYNDSSTGATTQYDHRMDITWMRTDAKSARDAGKAYLIGEYDWRNNIQTAGDTAIKSSVTRAQWLAAVLQEAEGCAWWCVTSDYTAVHNDGYQLKLPNTQNTEQNNAKLDIVSFNGTMTTTATNPPAPVASSGNLLAGRDLANFDSPATAYSTGVNSGTAPTPTQVQTPVADGANALRVRANGAGYWYVYPTNSSADIAAKLAPVTAGSTYTAMVHGQASAAGQSLVARVVWFTSTAGFISGSDGGSVALSTSAYSQARMVAVAPANASYAMVQAQNGNLSVSGQDTFLDKAGVFAGDVTTWVSPA